MIDFTTLQGLTIPEGVVTQIADVSGRVLWVLSGGKVILEVEKVTSDVYEGETLYTGEQFILLDIYPKTNGTVNVTYGGLTKTITDTSGAEKPNAQRVHFGTFGGVSDSVSTPASGELMIKGDCYAFAQATWKPAEKSIVVGAPVPCITKITSLGSIIETVTFGFGKCSQITSVKLPESLTTIQAFSFYECTGLTNVTIPKSVVTIGDNPFVGCFNLTNIVVDNKNSYFTSEGPVLFNKDKTYMICASGVAGDYTIPASVERIGLECFSQNIRNVILLVTTPPIIDGSPFGPTEELYIQTITVPKGCGDIYKAAEGWKNYADYIVEAS